MKRSSRFPVSVVFAYIAVIGMYLPVSILGFVTYGKDIDPNILVSIQHNQRNPSKVTVDIVLALITLHLMSSFVIVLNPVSQQFEELFNIPQSKYCELESVDDSRQKSIMKLAESISTIAFICVSSFAITLEKIIAIYALDGIIQPLNNWDQMDTYKLIFILMFVYFFSLHRVLPQKMPSSIRSYVFYSWRKRIDSKVWSNLVSNWRFHNHLAYFCLPLFVLLTD